MALDIDVASVSPDTQIPNELVHKILTGVLADSVHSICLSPGKAPWEMNVAVTISSVSFTFNQIMKEVAAKAFAIVQPKHGGSILPMVRSKLEFLRDLAITSRQPLHAPPARPHLICEEGSQLIRAYCLYLSAVSLRQNAAQTPVYAIYMGAHDTMLHALYLARVVCKGIQPRGMSNLLVRAVASEMSLVQLGKSVVQARVDLEACLEKMTTAEISSSDEKMRSKDTIKITIHEVLRKIETSGDFNRTSFLTFFAEEPYRSFQLPALEETVKKCGCLALDLDEYDIRERANSLATNFHFV